MNSQVGSSGWGAWRDMLNSRFQAVELGVSELRREVSDSRAAQDKSSREVLERLARMEGTVRINTIKISALVSGIVTVVVAVFAAVLRHWIG
jgi:hypothetical protein